MAQNTKKNRWFGKSENDILMTKKSKTLPVLLHKFSSQLDFDIIRNVAENHNWECKSLLNNFLFYK